MRKALLNDVAEEMARRLASSYFPDKSKKGMFPALPKAAVTKNSNKLIDRLTQMQLKAQKARQRRHVRAIDRFVVDKKLAVQRAIDCSSGIITGINYVFLSTAGCPIRLAVDGQLILYRLDSNLPRVYTKTLRASINAVKRAPKQHAKNIRSLFATITAIEAYLNSVDATYTSSASLPRKGDFSLSYSIEVRDQTDMTLRLSPRSMTLYSGGKYIARVPFTNTLNIVNLIQQMDLLVPTAKDTMSYEGFGALTKAVRQALARMGYIRLGEEASATEAETA